MAIQLYERTKDSAVTASFAVRQGESVREYWLFDDVEMVGNEQTANLEATLKSKIMEILGGTIVDQPSNPTGGTPGGPGSINRRMPKCDPQFNSFFADSINLSVASEEFYGAGQLLVDPILKVQPLPTFANYSAYVLNVKFSSKRYRHLRNEDMLAFELDFFNEQGGSMRLHFYQEWLRFCIFSGAPMDIRIKATIRAGMRFRCPGFEHAGKLVHGAPCDDVPDMSVPDSLLTVTWLGVPQRYIDDSGSFLNKYKGYVNQTAFSNGRSTWPPATLLYLGYQIVDPHTQLTFTPVPFDGDEDALFLGTFAGSECVDLQLQFHKTDRVTTTPPGAANIINPNWIPLGHNLLPHFASRQFFYVTNQGGFGINDDTAASRKFWVPSYLSVPFELLFQDPKFAEDNVFPLP